MKELTTALREQPVRGERPGTALGVRTAPSAQGFSNLEDLCSAVANHADVIRPHLFWALQDLLDRCGPPQALRPENGVLLVVYNKPGTNDGSCTFGLYGGRVVYVMKNS